MKMRNFNMIRNILFLPMAIFLILQLPMSVSANRATSYTYAAD